MENSVQYYEYLSIQLPMNSTVIYGEHTVCRPRLASNRFQILIRLAEDCRRAAEFKCWLKDKTSRIVLRGQRSLPAHLHFRNPLGKAARDVDRDYVGPFLVVGRGPVLWVCLCDSSCMSCMHVSSGGSNQSSTSSFYHFCETENLTTIFVYFMQPPAMLCCC